MLSAAEIACIQSTAATSLDKSCTIRRATTTKDAYGTATESLSTVATTMAGMAQPSAGLLTNYATLIESLATWKVRMPEGTDVRVKDQLEIEGQTLIVQVLLTPQSYSVFTNCLASEVK